MCEGIRAGDLAYRSKRITVAGQRRNFTGFAVGRLEAAHPNTVVKMLEDCIVCASCRQARCYYSRRGLVNNNTVYDFAIVGGGLVGLATARAIRAKHPKASIVLIEKEPEVAMHQSGRNSGVLHSGIYYKRGSLKANLTARGRIAVIDFCDEHGIRYELCGKLILAAGEEDFAQLDLLFQLGIENGLAIKTLNPNEIREIEPHASGLRGIWIPEAGIVDFKSIAQTLFRLLTDLGVKFKLGTRVEEIDNKGQGLKLKTNNGNIVAQRAVNCAGLFSDRLARSAGTDPGLRIIPFRGEYFQLRPEAKHLVRGLIYPLADPRLPFLGVHLTRTTDGEVLAGPNAVFALHREGYRASDIRISDLLDSLSYVGFWRLARRHVGSGLGEMLKAWNVSTFTRAACKLVPEFSADDFVPTRAGVRAQAVDGSGKLVDDFRFVQKDKWLHVLNAPSPAATACFAIGELIAQQVNGPIT